MLKRVVLDRRCCIPAGMRIGVDAQADRDRFQVTAGGITLVTPEMLGSTFTTCPDRLWCMLFRLPAIADTDALPDSPA